MLLNHSLSSFFFFNDPATTEIYTLSLHDALPISSVGARNSALVGETSSTRSCCPTHALSTRIVTSPSTTRVESAWVDRKSTRLNSSHVSISYAVFCLKKKKQTIPPIIPESKNPIA